MSDTPVQRSSREAIRLQMVERTIEAVLMFLWNHKVTAVEKLFPDAVREYQEEWYMRDSSLFFSHLDIGNRRRLIKMALQTYNPELLEKFGNESL